MNDEPRMMTEQEHAEVDARVRERRALAGMTCSASSDTPETDAEINGQYAAGNTTLSLSRFARKLERERDEARATLGGLIMAVMQTVGGASMMHPRLTRCIIAAQKIIPQNANMQAPAPSGAVETKTES